MKSRAIIPLVVGLGVGILAIKMFTDVLRKARGANSGETVQVVCAGQDIGPTMEIKETMVEVKPVPKALVPPSTLGSKQEVVGRVASMPIPRGMPVVQSLLAPKGTAPGMAVRIRDGFRAVAVKVDEFAGVAGWIKPGSHVDVVAVMQVEGSGSRRGTISKVILDNVEVLAVGQDLGNTKEVNASVTKSVTLLVKPEDVPKLHLASTKGTIKLSMRNQTDSAIAASPETTDKELLSLPSGPDETQSEPPLARAKSILSRLFHKEPKIALHETDKETEDPGEATQPAEVPAASAAVDPSWRVEVMTGTETQEVWFSDDGKNAHRLDQGRQERSGGRANKAGCGLGGSGVPAVRTSLTAAHRELKQPTESTE